ncbi:MAG: lamin tail domain-containing protein [Sandaracinaceae bacterium]|nr:lamin tail domain-containing protein [Sandaracinaceae bacterium]
MRCVLTCVTTFVLAILVTSCFEVPILAPRDAPERDTPRRGTPEPVVIVSIVARDVSGRLWPFDALPRQPRFEIVASRPLLADPEALFVIEGEVDDALREDVSRRPLTIATRARRIDAAIERDGTSVTLTPRAPLAPGAPLAVIVAGFAASDEGESLGSAEIVAGSVSREARAGARVVGAFPADGTLDVPLDAAPLVLAIDGDVLLGASPVRLEVGDAVSAPRVSLVRCEPLGFAEVTCLWVEWATALAPASPVVIETTDDLRDATGAVIEPVAVHVTTSSGPDLAPPSLIAPSACAIDAAPDRTRACVIATDRSWRADLVADEPVRVELTYGGGALRAIAPRGEARMGLAGLEASARLDGTLTLVDLAGRRTAIPWVIATTPPLAPITITEVCADPEGPEPAQEWVELANVGAASASLEGLSLADREDDEGQPLRSSRVLVSGARVLVVGEGFDPDLAGVPAGTPLVTVGRTIVPSGLSNAGEPLVLRDGEGHRLAFVPSLATEEGRCLGRLEPEALRADAIEDFHYSACTPGR